MFSHRKSTLQRRLQSALQSALLSTLLILTSWADLLLSYLKQKGAIKMKGKLLRNGIGISHHSNLWQKVWKYRHLYILSIPGLIYLLVFRYSPMYGLQLAFKDYNIMKGITGSDWVGWKHFIELFSDNVFPQVVRNTILINLYKLIIGFPAPIILALLLNEVKNTFFKKSVQTISYIPHFISWVVISGIFIDILSPNYGVVNKIIELFGGDPVFFLSSTKWFRSILVGTDIYKTVGWSSIIYLAAIISIDPQLYEAAIVDGANRFKRIWHITIPGIRPTMVVLLILRIGQMMNAGREQVLMLYNPVVYEVGDIIDTFVYRVAFTQFELSLTTAAGLFKSVVACVLLIVANTFAKKYTESSIF